jgi:glucose-6-phosphate-specific signal transduction histidine kinase
MAADICLLLCFYAAGNYFIVREGSSIRFSFWSSPDSHISFAWFFWCWTILIPLIYIYRGIQKKDAVFLRVGLVLVAAIVFTVRYYHHVLPAEIAMTIGGCLLLAIAYALTRYLRQPRHGYTSLPSDDPHITEKLRVESLLVVESFGRPAQQPTDTGGTQFGGGSGSGGGASGEY